MRVFREDVLACPCGGRRVVLAYLTQPWPVKAILDHLGLPSTVSWSPPRGRAASSLPYFRTSVLAVDGTPCSFRMKR